MKVKIRADGATEPFITPQEIIDGLIFLQSDWKFPAVAIQCSHDDIQNIQS